MEAKRKSPPPPSFERSSSIGFVEGLAMARLEFDIELSKLGGAGVRLDILPERIAWVGDGSRVRYTRQAVTVRLPVGIVLDFDRSWTNKDTL